MTLKIKNNLLKVSFHRYNLKDKFAHLEKKCVFNIQIHSLIQEVIIIGNHNKEFNKL